jgi:hypothetical protein
VNTTELPVLEFGGEQLYEGAEVIFAALLHGAGEFVWRRMSL